MILGQSSVVSPGIAEHFLFVVFFIDPSRSSGPALGQCTDEVIGVGS
jgi:hypothetical protein